GKSLFELLKSVVEHVVSLFDFARMGPGFFNDPSSVGFADGYARVAGLGDDFLGHFLVFLRGEFECLRGNIQNKAYDQLLKNDETQREHGKFALNEFAADAAENDTHSKRDSLRCDGRSEERRVGKECRTLR